VVNEIILEKGKESKSGESGACALAQATRARSGQQRWWIWRPRPCVVKWLLACREP